MKSLRTVAILSLASLAIGAFVWMMFWKGDPNQGSNAVEAPECRIVMLDQSERLIRANTPHRPTHHHAEQVLPKSIIPNSLGDNPIVLADHFAVVVFRNTTTRPIKLYSLRKKHGSLSPFADALRVKTEVTMPNGTVLEVLDPTQSMIELPIPSARVLKDANADIYTLELNTTVELKFPLLGDFPRLFNHAVADSLTERETRKKVPGTYSVRVEVTYLDETSGEQKRIFSNSVQIEVTAVHISQADAFINAK